jgi:hypothetical protein
MKINQNGHLIVSFHAIDRAIERWSMRWGPAEQRILEVFRNGLPFGSQSGRGAMFVLDDHVITVHKTKDGLVCKTVLTMDMAIAETERCMVKTGKAKWR